MGGRWVTRARLAEGVLLAAAGALYVSTMSRSIAVGDAGELALAAHAVGVPHPPGYPLYTLLGRLALLVPVGSPAARLNGLSVACAVGALALHLALGARLGLGAAPRLAATSLLAGSASLWSQANIAEVYALHLVLVQAALLVAMRLAEPRASAPGPGGPAGDRRPALLLAYLVGLAGAHHPSGVLLVPVALLAGAAAARRGARPPLLACGALLALPFTLFAVLPIRSRLEPAIDWGNPETLGALAAHIGRSRYGDLRQFARPLGALAGQCAAFGRFLADDLSIPFAIAAPLGGALLVAARPLAGALLAAFFLLFSAGTILLVNFRLDDLALYDNRVFFLPAVAAAALGAGAVFEAAIRAIAGARGGARGTAARVLGAGAAAAALVAIPVALAAQRAPRMDRRDHTVAEDLGWALLTPIDPGATLLASEGQAVHSLAYVSGVLGARPDVRILDRLGVLGGGRGLGGRPLPPGRAPSAAIFATDADVLRARGLYPVPWGLVYRGGSSEERISPGVWESLSFRRPERVESIDFVERDVLVGTYVRMAEHVAWAGLRVRGEDALREARRLAGPEADRRFASDFARGYAAVGLDERALASWRAAAAAAPEDPGPLRAAGLTAGRLARWAEAESLLAECARRAPGDAAVLVDLGGARYARGDSAGARAAWEAALGRDPANGEAARGLALLGSRPPSGDAR
jgi:hypothetical protein